MLKEISVILLTYKQKEILQLQLGALSVQRSSPVFEVIITEDGSHSLHDKGILKKVRNLNFPIKYIWQPDIGERRARARNNGIKAADGKVLIFLDGDMLPDENFIHNHIRHHQGERLMVAGDRVRRPLSSVDSSQDIRKILVGLRSYGITGDMARRQANEENRRRLFLKSTTPWRGCFSCNFSVLNSPHIRFDEHFVGWGPDDRELFYRLTKNHGYKVAWDKGAIAYEMETGGKVGNVFLGNNHRDIVNYLRNVLYFYDRCPDLTLEEAFWFLPRLVLKRNRWQVIGRPSRLTDSQTLAEMVRSARHWLRDNE